MPTAYSHHPDRAIYDARQQLEDNGHSVAEREYTQWNERIYCRRCGVRPLRSSRERDAAGQRCKP